MPQDDAQETFAQWRIWIIKTLDKLSEDVDALKRLTTDREDYLRRFERVERDMAEVRSLIGDLTVTSAVTKRTLAMYSSIAAVVGSTGTIFVKWLLGQ